jgi:diguanylate cyclase (GGDEF)-like protein
MSRVEVNDGLGVFFANEQEPAPIEGSKAGRIINLLDKRRARKVVRMLWFFRRIPVAVVIPSAIGGLFLSGIFGPAIGSPYTVAVLNIMLVAVSGWAGGILAGQLVALSGAWICSMGGAAGGVSTADLSGNTAGFLLNLFILGATAYLSAAISSILFYEQKSSHTDPLTGLANRRLLNEYFKGEIQRARRNYRPISVVFMDIDNFKEVNDRFGHLAGDSLLRTMADILLTSTRDIDSVARLGGDEFGLLMPETDENGVRLMLDRIRERFNWQVQCAGWPVSLSIGAAVFMAPPNDLDVCLDAADRLLSSVKQNGKNNTMFVIFR